MNLVCVEKSHPSVRVRPEWAGFDLYCVLQLETAGQ